MEGTNVKILFVCDQERPYWWKDGLRAAIEILSKKYEIQICNIARDRMTGDCDIAIGWGGFESPVDKLVRQLQVPKALCVGGNAYPPHNQYDLLFYETHWYEQYITNQERIHAFGINSGVFFDTKSERFIDFLTVGAFSEWKRQHLLVSMGGIKLAIGEIQKENYFESEEIIKQLLGGGVGVYGAMSPENLATFYNKTKKVYIPANINGGGERAILEARACGCEVLIEDDNPKLQELLTSPIWDEKYYASQLEKGIETLCQKLS